MKHEAKETGSNNYVVISSNESEISHGFFCCAEDAMVYVMQELSVGRNVTVFYSESGIRHVAQA